MWVEFTLVHFALVIPPANQHAKNSEFKTWSTSYLNKHSRGYEVTRLSATMEQSPACWDPLITSELDRVGVETNEIRLGDSYYCSDFRLMIDRGLPSQLIIDWFHYFLTGLFHCYPLLVWFIAWQSFLFCNYFEY